VTKWLHKEDERKWYKNRVNAGIHILSPEVFEYFDSKPKKLDLDRDILQKLIPRGELFCYDSPEYVKDMGTPKRYKQVEADIKSGLVRAKNLKNKQFASFLDRDGTINKHVGFLRDIDDFELNEGIIDVIGQANKKGRLVIVVTNQPVIARGEVTWDQLGEIHNKMETLLGERGVYVDAIYVCPHHPDKGFEGEKAEYKINCDCRKPKPGMLLRAAEKYNIDLSQSEMIGDSDADLQAGNNAGITNVCVMSF
jgi:D-glycero-D-manno-heptose 1,7-bisphosphate phosphatase